MVIEYQKILAWRCDLCGTVSLPHRGKRPETCQSRNALKSGELCGGTEWEPQEVLKPHEARTRECACGAFRPVNALPGCSWDRFHARCKPGEKPQ
jgi:hypothetical protein